MLIDEVSIKIKAGKGGDGSVAFNKNMMSLGPTGATGGHGGSIYVQGVTDLGALRQFRNKKEIKATNGEVGGAQYRDGQDGDDVTVLVPVGTVITKKENKETIEILNTKDKILLAKGGYGGKGNFHFRSSLNTSPQQFKKGTEGEKFSILIQLKLIADVGLIGLPNAGKSSLLNALTNAKSSVANYPFTTLEPHLGAYYELILADIPGLIEGASTGKGLGIKFLKHVERTKVLFHLISAESENITQDYKTIRNELEQYNPELLNKKEYVFLSKIDMLDPKEVEKKFKELKKVAKDAQLLSVNNEETLKNVKKILAKIQESK